MRCMDGAEAGGDEVVGGGRWLGGDQLPRD